MASVEVKRNFVQQLKESRQKIQDSFKRSHESLQARESNLLSLIDQIEKDYNSKAHKMNKLVEALNHNKLMTLDTLTDNELSETHQIICSAIDKKITELTAEIDSRDRQHIKLNGQTNKSHTDTFPPQVKPVVPNYKSKQLPTAYSCKKSNYQKSSGELNDARSVAVHYLTGNIYIADENNNRVQIFTGKGDYLFMFSENMNNPRGICISQNNVFVTQHSGNCINKYDIGGKLIKNVGSRGKGKIQFNEPYGIDVSDRNSNIYVYDSNNKRVKILTEELNFHSILGEGLLSYPLDVKVTRDRVIVIDDSDPCMFVFNSDHVLTNRMITKGVGKQTNFPICFDIDREYNIIMSDYYNHCVCIFNQKGEQIHKFGKEGQGIGEFYHPYGIALDNAGHIIVVCQKDNNCLQFF
ncbi:PKD domain-containing protein [Oopsacas minuta]|uniref:PKD domain-containing protein n=1 Tax=Oopsacas minuta TaxID=111878 RepID=A0AAV7JKG5_9METZ|nr:PKD domain-containing protein [Oopsacas minuta]